MQKWILLFLINIMAWQVQAQHKKRINFNELDVIRGLFFQPNTIKPYSGTAFDKFSDGKKRLEIQIKDGKINGKFREWLQNGTKILDVKYVDGKKHGKEIQWYAIGKKKVEVNYVNDNVEGVVTEWYKNENKKSEGIFRNGKEQGEHTWWFDNGQIDQIVFYENGLAQGVVKNWFRGGKLRLESNFKDGQKNGLTTEWFNNGQKFSEGSFKEGKEDGKSYVWTKKGKLIKENTHDFGKLIESKDYRSGSIKTKGGYIQVFNEMNDFFKLDISGRVVWERKAEEITYVVDGDLLQIFNQSANRYFDESFSTISEKELLEKYIEKETQFISTATNFEIQPKSKIGKTTNGKEYIYWHFVSPSSKAEEQKPRTVQEEHYISFICGNRILSLYGVVTNNNKPVTIKTMLQRIANTLKIEKERINLNAVASSIK